MTKSVLSKKNVKNWDDALLPLINEYNNRPHPLEYKNNYQLIVMVILSAQSNDKLINDIAPALFKAFPDFKSMAAAQPEQLDTYIRKVRGSLKKGRWLISAAQQLQSESNIPATMNELIKLPGIGRKSANVILRQMGHPAEGIIVDLHVLRVAPRLGIASGTDGLKMEKELMQNLSPDYWGDAGMALSFLGRDTCRPTNPDHLRCPIKDYCSYFKKQTRGKSIQKIKKPSG